MFNFEPAPFVPYKNKAVLDKVRALSGKDLEKHPNPHFKIKVIADPGAVWIGDMVKRIGEHSRRVPKPCR